MKILAHKAAALAVLASLIIGLAGTGITSEAAKPKLNKKYITLETGQKFKLKVKKYTKKVKWTSSKKKVATVSKKGVVTAKSKGTAKITAKCGKIKLVCKVKVLVFPDGPCIGPTQAPTQTPTQAPSITEQPQPTAEPTEVPEPTATPKYMQEGAFVYDKLDISWIDPEKPMIAFTFDDGPVGTNSTSYSMRILNALREGGAHATFNYVTSKLNNDDMRKEVLIALEDGHEIANHTSQWSSLSDTSKFPTPESIAEEIERSRATLSELTGISDFTVRPPNLGQNAFVLENVNVPMIGCNIISNDWENVTKEHVVSVTKNAKDGDIVLFHETTEHTAAAVEELVPYFIEQGYQIVSVVELFAAKDIPLFRGNYYNKAEYMEPKF